jgi:Avidin family
MSWVGTWRNQYGSTVTITSEEDGRISGSFRTAIESSPYSGAEVPVTGAHSGSTIAFVAGLGPQGNSVVSYTGKLQDGVMETLWFVVVGEQHWWRSVITNHDTFKRVD